MEGNFELQTSQELKNKLVEECNLTVSEATIRRTRRNQHNRVVEQDVNNTIASSNKT